MASIFDEFTNKYSISKTLRFELRPIGRTQELIRKIKDEKDFVSPLAPLILEDKERTDAYKRAKRYIDDLHRSFLAFSLDERKITNKQRQTLTEKIREYYNLHKEDKEDKEDEKIVSIQRDLAKQITQILDENAPYFLKNLKDQRDYLQQLKIQDEKSLQKLKEERNKLAKTIKQADKQDIQRLETLKEKRAKFDKNHYKLERAIKEYNKALKFQFDKSSKIYSKTDELFTLLSLYYIQDQEAMQSIAEFDGFHTYFTGFNANRENIYDMSGRDVEDTFKSTSIAHRLFEQNIQFHFDNIQKWESLQNAIQKNQGTLKEKNWDWNQKLAQVEKNLQFKAKEFFKPDSFVQCFSQQGIDRYNKIIGGTPAEEQQEKVQGLNELINLTRQQAGGARKDFSSLQEFYKQILSERKGNFIDEFHDNRELIEAINDFVKEEDQIIENIETCNKESGQRAFNELLEELKEDKDSIYISREKLRFFSQDLTGRWNAIETWYLDGFNDSEKKKQAKRKVLTIGELENSLYEEREWVDSKENVEKASFYIQCIQTANTTKRPWLKNTEIDPQDIFFSYLNSKCKYLIEERKKYLKQYQNSSIKQYLDTSQDVFRFFKNIIVNEKREFIGTDKKAEQNQDWKDTIENFTRKNYISHLYNKARNFLTKKPFSVSKFKLNFENPTLADGWDVNREKANAAVLLRKDGLYYLGIMKKRENSIFEQPQELQSREDDYYEKMNYKSFKDGTTMIPKCSTQLNEVKKHFAKTSDDFNTGVNKKFCSNLVITKEIFNLNNMVYDQKTALFVAKNGGDKRPKKFQKEYLEITNDKDGYNEALNKWINFCMDFCKTYTSVVEADYEYKDTFNKKYDSLDQFYQELSGKIYKVTFSKKISKAYINKMVEEEKLYLFQIYNKDFSTYKKKQGTDNLHTIYWKMLFDAENLSNVVLKLSGEAELFYRPASVKYSQEIRKRGCHYGKLKNDFKYPILKNRRYSEDKVFFHCPVVLNFRAEEKKYLNNEINQFLCKNIDVINIIGIDRGERNLLYYTIIDQQGTIIKQGSLNSIDNGFKAPIDYHSKLDKKERQRATARENWETIESIKDLKSGYLSQVVYQLAKLIIDHNAIVVLEDLNFGFKRGRFKIEKQIYQKFEKTLIDKLNYLVFKNKTDPNQTGHPMKAYQLTNKFESFTKLRKQSGILFYTAAGYTSKTDPVTGYMRMLYPKYTNAKQAQDFFSKFDSVIYNGKHFEFSYNLKNLKGMTGSLEDKKEMDETKLDKVWTIHSCVERSQWMERKLTEEEKDLPQYEGANNGKWKCHQIININQRLKNLFEKEGLELEQGKDYKETICNPNQTERFQNSKFLAKLITHFSRLLDMRVTDSSKAKKEYDVEDDQGKVCHTDNVKDINLKKIKRSIYKHNPESDFILSPVEPFYDSRKVNSLPRDKDPLPLPLDSDANGAYNIARKGVLILEKIKEANGNITLKGLTINKTDWQNYAQREEIVKKQKEKYSPIIKID